MTSCSPSIISCCGLSAVFDIKAAEAGQSVLQWRPNLGTRIGVVGLDGSPPAWLEADPFFVFHFANGFERGGHIVVDYVRHDALHLGQATDNRKMPSFHQ